MATRMSCEEYRLRLEALLERGAGPDGKLQDHLDDCPGCRAYAYWLDLGLRGLGGLPVLSPSRVVFKDIRRQLLRERILTPWYAPVRVAGPAALAAAAAAAGLLVAASPGIPRGFAEGLLGRVLGLVRPLWMTVRDGSSILAPLGAALVRVVEVFISRFVALPWFEASLLSLAAATATAATMLLCGARDRRRLGHALVL